MTNKQITTMYLEEVLKSIKENKKIESIDISGLFKLLLNNYLEVSVEHKEIDILLLETIKSEINMFINKIKN